MTSEFFQRFSLKIISYLHKLVQILREEEIFLNLFYETRVTLMPKPNKHINKKGKL